MAVLSLGLIAPAYPADEPNSPRTLVELRIVQLNAKAAEVTPGRAARDEAVQPEMILDPNSSAVVCYVAPRGKNVLLGGRVLPASRGKVCTSRPGTTANAAVDDRRVRPPADGNAGAGARERRAAEEDSPWTELSAPNIVCYVGQTSAIDVGARVPYMVKRPDGSFVMEQDEPEGLHVELEVGEATASSVRIDNLEIKLSQVVGREAIPDVPFDIGRPQYRTRHVRTALRLAPDKVAIIPLPLEQEQVYVLVAARLIQAEH